MIEAPVWTRLTLCRVRTHEISYFLQKKPYISVSIQLIKRSGTIASSRRNRIRHSHSRAEATIEVIRLFRVPDLDDTFCELSKIRFTDSCRFFDLGRDALGSWCQKNCVSQSVSARRSHRRFRRNFHPACC